jgi:hypothetical protein
MDYKEWARRYMCKRWLSTDETTNAILTAIKNDKPLSYTRFGDGDLILLKEYFNQIKNDPYYVDLCNADNHIDKVDLFPSPELNTLGYYARQFQSEMKKEHFENRWGVYDHDTQLNIIEKIGKDHLFALQNSTHIGIWDIEKEVLNGTADDFYVWQHSYVPHIELFANCGVDFKTLCDGWVVKNNSYFANPYKFRDIIKGKPIHIFTSNEYELKHISKLHEILNTKITYTNITPVKGDYNTFSFMHYDFLHKECENIDAQIVLYGLGYGAKHIPSYLSNNYGKTVIDMGAILDGWAGKITRPYMETKDIIPTHIKPTTVSWFA